MILRLKFAALTGVIGLLIGVVVALVLQKEGEAFPTYVILPLVALFAIAGGSAKKDWAESVLDFFHDVLP